MAIIVKSRAELGRMREAGAVLSDLFRELEHRVRPAVTTGELDRFIEEYIVSRGCRPSFKNLYGFPASACISVNDEVVHGIPGSRKLRDGDLVKIDVGAIAGGMHADAARTYTVGEADAEVRRLVETAQSALDAGIRQARAGNRVSDISAVVQSTVEGAGYSVVRDFVGHGVGRELHEDPQVPNYRLPWRNGPRLRPGMTLAIEPMLNAGSYEVVVDADGWTVRTKDGRLSANVEDTVAVTEHGPEILTR